MIDQCRIEKVSSVVTSNQWQFIALGDSRQQFGTWDYDNDKYTHENSSNPTRAALITSVVQNNPNLEFIIHSGDIVASGGEQDDWNRYFEDIENATLENSTFYYAVGNHEKYTYALSPSEWGPDDEDFSTYHANVELPGNERYYSFNYMNQIHFVFINTEEDWTGSTFDITSDQYNWLINDLEQNEINFTIAIYHRPSYSIRDSNRVYQAQQVRAVLEPIFLQYGVDLVFSGHDHYYYRTIRSGVTYVTTGGGGADLYTNGDLSEWQDGDVYFSEFHYCNITVTEDMGQVGIEIQVLIFNESDKSTSIGDSFIVNDTIQAETTTLGPTTSPTTSTTTIPKKTTLFILSMIMGILFVYNFKKR